MTIFKMNSNKEALRLYHFVQNLVREAQKKPHDIRYRLDNNIVKVEFK